MVGFVFGIYFKEDCALHFRILIDGKAFFSLLSIYIYPFVADISLGLWHIDPSCRGRMSPLIALHLGAQLMHKKQFMVCRSLEMQVINMQPR